MGPDDQGHVGYRALAIRWLPFAILGGIVVVAISVLLVTRWSAPERVVVDLSSVDPSVSASTTTGRGKELRIAVGSMLTPTSNFEAYGDLIDLIGERTGRTTNLVLRETYGEINDLIARGDVDVAFVCSGAYIELRRAGAAALLAVPVVDGETTYFSKIIARPGLPATRFEDLRGTTFAFVDPLSNSGYYYPRWRVRGMGEDVDTFFGHTTFTHSHETSVEMVARGVVDAAAVDNLVFDAVVEQHPSFREEVQYIEDSDKFGIPPVVIREDIDPETRRSVREALLDMHTSPEGRVALAQLEFERFVRGEDAHYESVELMLTEKGPSGP